MKLYIITGEPSGDLHAANIVKEIKKKDNISIRAWGGDKLMEEGVDIARSINKTSFMGFLDVILNIRQVYDNINFCKQDIINYNPDLVLLVDYAGFNLKIAKFCKKNNIKVMYYIAPKVWAWNSNRLKAIRKYIDKLLVIFPFEKRYFKQNLIDSDYVGNPVNDLISVNTYKSLNYKKPIIALLPGSRKQEIQSILPKMLEVIDNFRDYQFVIAATNNFTELFYNKYISDYDNVDIIYNQTHNILLNSKAALITSGTANLEASLLKVPQIVCYHTHWFNYFLGRIVIKTNYISLPNILLDKKVIPELIQKALNKENITIELKNLIEDKQDINYNYKKLVSILGDNKSYYNVANTILGYL